MFSSNTAQNGALPPSEGDAVQRPQADPFEGMGAAIWIALATIVMLVLVISALMWVRPAGSVFP